MSHPISYVFLVAGLLEILLPLFLGFYFHRRFGVSWNVYVVGCTLFLLSLVRTPLNTAGLRFIGRSLGGFSGTVGLLLYAAFPALTAGVFEEMARYLGFKFFVKEHRFEDGLMYGAGHGGIESIVIAGINVLIIGVKLIFIPSSLPPGQLEIVLSLPFYLPLVGLYERIMAITIQVGLSIMVLQSFVKSNKLYLAGAILTHFFIDFVAIALMRYGIVWVEGLVAIFAMGLGAYVWRTWKQCNTNI